MKVLLVATVQSHICQFHRPLAEVLHAHGCELHAAAKDNLAEKNGMKLDFADRVFDVPFSRSPKSPENIKAGRILKQIIKDGAYDIIHCNTPMGGIVTRIVAQSARRHGTRVFYTAHGFHFYRGASKKNWLFFYPVEKLFSRRTDKLITITREDHELAKNKFHCEIEYIHGVGVDEKRYFPVDDLTKLSLKREMGFEASRKIILCIGELLPNKNQKMAVQMMEFVVKKYPEAVLLIAGNGPERDDLEREISSFHLDGNVQMLGYCTHLQDYQHIADVLVSCSRREGLPLNIVESMLSETPVVATVNRGHRELIEDGKTGFLVAVDDAEGMADRVVGILDNEKMACEIAERAYSFAGDYCFSSVKQELEKIYCG